MPRAWDAPLENRGKGMHTAYPAVGITQARQHDPTLCSGGAYRDTEGDRRCLACGKEWTAPRVWEERDDLADFAISKLGPRRNGHNKARRNGHGEG